MLQCGRRVFLLNTFILLYFALFDFEHILIHFKGDYWGEHGWASGDKEDGTARKAYEALLRVSLLKPTSTQFHNFSKLVKQKALDNYNYTQSENEEV